MRRVSRHVLAIVAAAGVVAGTAVDFAAAQSAFPAAAAPPAIAAKSWLLQDVVSGQTLASDNADAPREPASLTKLMTADLTFRALKANELIPSQIVPVSEKAWRAEGSRMFIEPNKAVTVDELLHGLIVQSGNDAAIALAEIVGKSEAGFVEQMNREAAQLGMKSTHFVNPTGLPAPQQVSTANDLALLATAIIRDFPDFYALYSIKEYRYNNITQPNRNRLLWSDPYVDGIKTGNTEAAGFCLIASARRGQRRLLAVVLGADSELGRATEAQKLLNYGFQFFDSVQLYQASQPVTSLRVWKGASDAVPAGFVVDRYISLPKGQAQNLKLSMQATEPLLAPVTKGQRVGVVQMTLDGKPLGTYPLLALDDVAPASLLGRAWDSIRLWLK